MKLLPIAVACAMISFPTITLAVETAGKTMVVKGTVQAFESEQEKRKLKRRSPIYNIDTVTTSPDSKAQFRMNDGTLLAIKESSTVLISDYQYNPGEEGNSAVIELVEGGLRSVTGAIKANNGSYKLKTPVGSIGIRGTHFEIEIVSGEMFLAVWDGAIDLSVPTDTGAGQVVSFGEGEDFSFGIVTDEGEVTQLLEAPDNFDSGHSEEGESSEQNEENDSEDESSEESESGDSQGSSESESSEGGSSENSESASNSGSGDSGSQVAQTTETTGDVGTGSLGGSDSGTPDVATNLSLGDEQSVVGQLVEETIEENDLADPEIIANRTGTFTYNQLIDSEVNSSAGGATNLNVTMTVDFDNGFVPDGSLSFTDNGGEWFAAFNGVIDVSEILLGVNFATHGEQLADGSINAFFANDGDRISGQFELFEIENTGVTANGRFQIE